jgi:transcriptional regulator GlxA family with amidase domain
MPNEPRFPPPARIVEIVAFPAVQLLDVTGPLQVFATANEMATGGSQSAAPYQVNVVAPGGTSVTTSSGLGLLTHPLPPRDSPPDTLLVAGLEAGLLSRSLKGGSGRRRRRRTSMIGDG